VTLEGADQVGAAVAALVPFADGRPVVDGARATQVTVPVRPGTRLMEIARALDAAGVDAVDLHRREASLDDVFLSLTDRGQPSTLELAA